MTSITAHSWRLSQNSTGPETAEYHLSFIPRISYPGERKKSPRRAILAPRVRTMLVKERWTVPITKMERLKPMSRSILLVDDEEGVLEAFQALLERSGYTVRCAADLAEAEAACAREQFALAVVDLTLPGGEREGLKAIQLLASQKERPAIIAWSGMADDKVRKDVAEAGADSFLLKPVSIAALLERMREVLEWRS